MHDARKTKKQLIEELVQMRRRVFETQAAELKLQSVANALRQSETQFRKITEKSIVGVYLIQDDVFQYVNPNMAETCGYNTVDQMVGKKGPQDVVSDEDWPMVREYLRKRIAGEMDSIHYSFRGKRPSGETVHLEVYGSRMDYHGRPAVIGTILNITQRVRAERELEMQLKRFQALYRLAVAMTAERSLEENLMLLVDKSRELLEADASLIAVRDQKTERLRVCACAGLGSEDLYGLELPMKHLSKRKAATKKDRCFEEDFRKLRQSCRNKQLLDGLLSGIAASVKLKERELGVLCVGSEAKRSFTDSQRNLLSLMANMAALEINRKQADEALSRSEDRLRLLSRQLLSVQEDERKRVAQDLHDGIGQSVTAMKFEVEAVIRKASASVPEKHLAPMKSLVPMIQQVVEEVGRIAMDLRPSILDDLGIHATISWLCREFGRTHPNVRVEKRLEMEESQVPDSHKIVIFRILQEALNNVAKHSGAKTVHVSLRKPDGRTELIVQDDGVGFDWDFSGSPAGNERGFGLASMKERAQLSGGSFSVQTSRGNGTTVTARWSGR